MNTDYEKRLESAVQRELTALPAVPAPRSLATRVMAVVAARRLPWYRQSWEMWPRPLQIAALSFLVAVFAAVCYGGLRVPEIGFVSESSAKVREAVHFATSGANVIEAILTVIVSLVKACPTGFLIGCLAAAILGYAACLGLGTLYWRLAFSRPQN